MYNISIPSDVTPVIKEEKVTSVILGVIILHHWGSLAWSNINYS